MFYHYSQNNSGGNFDYYPEGIGLYFDGSGDCPCCGYRWSEMWDESEGKEVPTVYGVPVEEYDPRDGIKWIDGYETFVHYADGSFKGFHE